MCVQEARHCDRVVVDVRGRWCADQEKENRQARHLLRGPSGSIPNRRRDAAVVHPAGCRTIEWRLAVHEVRLEGRWSQRQREQLVSFRTSEVDDGACENRRRCTDTVHRLQCGEDGPSHLTDAGHRALQRGAHRPVHWRRTLGVNVG